MKKMLRNITKELYYYDGEKKILGAHSKITGNISGLTGDVSGLIGVVTNIEGNLDSCDITEADRKKDIEITKLVE